jgi:hypothetical protein
VLEPVKDRVPDTIEDDGKETTTLSLIEKKCGSLVVKTTEAPEISLLVTTAEVLSATVIESPTE